MGWLFGSYIRAIKAPHAVLRSTENFFNKKTIHIVFSASLTTGSYAGILPDLRSKGLYPPPNSRAHILNLIFFTVKNVLKSHKTLAKSFPFFLTLHPPKLKILAEFLTLGRIGLLQNTLLGSTQEDNSNVSIQNFVHQSIVSFYLFRQAFIIAIGITP